MTSSKNTRPVTGRSRTLGQGKFGLQDGDLVQEAGSPVLGRERVRQTPEPLAPERIDLACRQLIGEFLQ